MSSELITAQEVRSAIEGLKPSFVKVLAEVGTSGAVVAEQTFMREAAFAVQALQANEYLMNVARKNPDSLKKAVYNVALTGTTLNPILAKAFLVPRGDTVCLDMSYRGLAGVAMDSGSVKHIQPYLVYDCDDFEFSIIDGEQHVKHVPSMTTYAEIMTDFWKHLVCGYVVAILHDGTRIITTPHPAGKLKRAMETSKTAKQNTPWRTHPDEMCLKTLVKHAYKLLPQTDRMSNAVSVLNEHEGLEQQKPVSSINERIKDGAGNEQKGPYTDEPEGGKARQSADCVCDEKGRAGESTFDCPKHGKVVA